MSINRIVELRDAVNELCAKIDETGMTPDEVTMLAIADVVSRECGPLAHDLLCQLASRCKNGRAALKNTAS